MSNALQENEIELQSFAWPGRRLKKLGKYTHQGSNIVELIVQHGMNHPAIDVQVVVDEDVSETEPLMNDVRPHHGGSFP